MIEVIVGAIRLEAQDIHSFELFRADGAALPSFEPGAHIDLHLPNGLVRQYSLCGPAERPRHYRIAVLRCRDSRGGSATLHAELRVGQRLRIGEPRNLFPLSPEPGPRLLFAGGIGITPLLAMAERLTRDGADFQLHYCAHSAERAAFVDYLGRCAFADRVHCHFDHGESSRRADLRALLATSPRDAQLYLCGPAGFMQWIEESARELGWEASRLHREHFAAAPRDASADGTFEVQLASNGALIRRRRADRAGGPARSRGGPAGLLRAGHLRHLPDPRAGRRAGASRPLPQRRGAGRQRLLHALLFAFAQPTAGAGSLVGGDVAVKHGDTLPRRIEVVGVAQGRVGVLAHDRLGARPWPLTSASTTAWCCMWAKLKRRNSCSRLSRSTARALTEANGRWSLRASATAIAGLPLASMMVRWKRMFMRW